MADQITTQEANLKGRVEYLENFLTRVYNYLDSGCSIKPNSLAHHETGIILGRIKPGQKNWGHTRKGK